MFRFIQDEAFTEPLYNKNINTIQKFMIYDTNSIFFSGYDYVENKSSFNSILRFYIIGDKIVWVNQFNQSILEQE